MKGLIISIAIILTALSINGQTTEFSYQGSLKDGANPANGNYDLEFRLFAVESGGTALGTLQRLNVQVANGTFSVKLNFGSQFPGAPRYLEISVRPAGGGTFQQLLPRQLINSSPYSVKSLNADTAVNATSAANAANATNAATAANALQLGGVAANQYVVTSDPRMSDARAPTAGSTNYLQNTLVQQSANFNISGTGTAGGTLSGGVVNATTQFTIGGNRVLSNAGTDNLFAGQGSGTLNTGAGNSYFGSGSGGTSTSGSNNSFFGSRAGINSQTGNFNTLIGHRTGENNNSGSLNTFVGTGAGFINNASSNSFFGHDAGSNNLTGTFNSAFGENADFAMQGLTNATAIGSKAMVSLSNSLVLGSISGINGASADTRVGIGISAPASKLHIFDASNTGLRVQTNTAGGTVASFGSNGVFNIDAPGAAGGRFTVFENGNVGIGVQNPSQKLDVSGTDVARIQVNAASNSGLSLSLANQPKWSVATVDPGQFQIYNQILEQNAFWINLTDNNVGVGATSPTARLQVNGGVNGLWVQNIGFGGFVAKFGDAGDFLVDSLGVSGGRMMIGTNGHVRINNPPLTGAITNVAERLTVNGFIRAFMPPLGIGIPVCQEAATSTLVLCAVSSLRYKKDVRDLTAGLDIVSRLRPVTFNWKSNNQHDLGLIAEEVESIDPLLVHYNAKGEVEGVKYDRLGVVLVNAVKEQQEMIEKQARTIQTQDKLITEQQRQIDELRAAICESKPIARICKQN